MDVDEGSGQNQTCIPSGLLKIEFTKGDKCHNLTSRLKYEYFKQDHRETDPWRYRVVSDSLLLKR